MLPLPRFLAGCHCSIEASGGFWSDRSLSAFFYVDNLMLGKGSCLEAAAAAATAAFRREQEAFGRHNCASPALNESWQASEQQLTLQGLLKRNTKSRANAGDKPRGLKNPPAAALRPVALQTLLLHRQSQSPGSAHGRQDRGFASAHGKKTHRQGTLASFFYRTQRHPPAWWLKGSHDFDTPKRCKQIMT